MKTKLIYLNLLILLSSTLVHAQLNGQLYTQKILNITDQWHTLDIPVSVLSKAKKNQSDIRIVGITADNDTISAPYFIEVLSEKKEILESPLQLLNPSRLGNMEYVTLKPESPRAINQIKLEFSASNFDYLLSLEGSNDNREWYTIVSDYRVLSIHAAPQKYSFTTILFPDSEYEYYRVAIPKATTSPSITSARTLYTEKSNESTVHYQHGPLSQKIEDNNTTLLEVTLKHHVPVASLQLLTKNENDFIRQIKISALVDSIQTEKGWTYSYQDVYSGNYTSFENHSYDLNNIHTNKLRILIYHGENSPFKVDDIRILGYIYRLTARFDKPANYYLAYGNKRATKPTYDIELFKDKIPKDLVQLTLEDTSTLLTPTLKDNESEPSKTWLWITMGIIILILGVFTVRMMRNT